jgi:hypothetical protein
MKQTLLLVLVVILMFGGSDVISAQTKKPGGNPAAQGKGAIVLGTTQMPGDFGKFGQTYTMGKYEPVNFTLKSAEYSIGSYGVEPNKWVPSADQKLLILHYTIHNPLPKEQVYDWSYMKFTVVDAKDKNTDAIQAVAREGTVESGRITLKPAQKAEVMSAIIVPAEGVVPKLIVEREKGQPVVRFDLRGKVTPLPSHCADPTDSSGATVRKEVEAKQGSSYLLGGIEARLESVTYSKEPLGEIELPAGKQNVSAVFTIKNPGKRSENYSWSVFSAILRDSDGEKVPYNQWLLKGSRNERAQGVLEPGEEARVRFFFEIPEKVTGKALLLKEGNYVGIANARVFAFDLTGGK